MIAMTGVADPFRDGMTAFEKGEFARAATNFHAAVTAQPASGALVNLGLAEWRRGRAGAAVAAWERALWLDPANAAARNNLRYARQFAEIGEPEWTWYEAASTWLPSGTWALAGGMSLWSAVALMTVPGLLRWRKAVWPQALAAASLCVFLLCVPAHIGILTRAKMGFVLEKKVPLRLTPTEEAERVATLGAGEPVRKIGALGEYYLIRTQQGTGWVERTRVGMISSDP